MSFTVRPSYDQAFFDQIVWNTAHGRWFETSFLPYNFLGQHVEPVLLLFAAGYRAGADGTLLLLVQAVVAAAAAFILYGLARHLLGSGWQALLLAGAWALSTPLHRELESDFHPEVLSGSLVFAAVWAQATGRRSTALVLGLSLLLLKEDEGLVLLGLGIFSWSQFRDRRTAMVFAGAGTAWLLLTVGVVEPFMRGWASGDQSQRVTVASSEAASRTSSWAGCFCQKSRSPKESPPLIPPT